MNFEGTITINGKTHILNQNDVFQHHIELSVDDFCELLQQELLVKFELSNNILIYHQMANKDHCGIDVNLLREASILFIKQKYYQILGENFAIATPNLDSYYLPDASIIIAKEVEYVKVGKINKIDAVANPLAAFEILSDSTEKYDRTVKSENYRKISSLKQYTFISQNEIKVENFVKNAFGEWSCTIYTSKNDYFAILEDQFQICVGNLYLQTSLDEDYQ
jgi:Uma2 family endonuclease